MIPSFGTGGFASRPRTGVDLLGFSAFRRCVDNAVVSNIAGTSIAQSIAGLNQAERTVAADRKPRTESTKPLREQLRDDVVVNTEGVEAVKNLADNPKEEARTTTTSVTRCMTRTPSRTTKSVIGSTSRGERGGGSVSKRVVNGVDHATWSPVPADVFTCQRRRGCALDGLVLGLAQGEGRGGTHLSPQEGRTDTLKVHQGGGK